MVYAQINQNIIVNAVDIEDPILIPLFSEGYDLFLRIDNLSTIPSISWTYNPVTCSFSPPPTISQQIVSSCVSCGNQIIFEWNVMNTASGIYATGQTIAFLNYVSPLYQLLSLGYLSDANDAITAMIADMSTTKTDLDPFLTNDILYAFQSQALDCLNNLPILE